MILRDYQEDFISNIRRSFASGARRVLGVMPTGSGKTVCFSYLAQQTQAKGKSINILVHREELQDQVSSTLKMLNVKHNLVAAGVYPPRTAQTLVSSVFTLVRRMDKAPYPDLIVIDEAHHAIGKSTWAKVLAKWPNALVLGVTATPTRLSGEGLGGLFDDMVVGPSVSDLIGLNHLCDYKMFCPPTINTDDLHHRAGDFAKKELEVISDKATITGDVISHYKKHTDNLPGIAFCVSIAHAHNVANQFRAAGYRAMAIDGKMDKSLRREVIRDFRSGQIQVLTSCDLISEGFDVPGVHVGMLLRATESLGLYLQQIGRILRMCEGKDFAYILDHVGNKHRHGLPDLERIWSLDGTVKTPNDRSEGIKNCPKCFYSLRSVLAVCPDCGHKFTPAEIARDIEEVAGDLEEMTKEQREYELEQAKFKRKGEQKKANSYEKLVLLAEARGYKKPEKWARYVWDSRQKKRGRAA